MGYWENTTYIETGNTERVITEIIALFSAEGMELVEEPSQLEYKIDGSMHYGDALESNFWGLAIFPGSVNWTVIKSAPLELLSEKVPDTSQMRLVKLCERLGALGFQLHVYNGCETLLVETDGKGDYVLSGVSVLATEHEPNALYFHGEHLLESRFEIRWLFAKFEAGAKSFHNGLICVFDGCVHFATQTPCAE